MLVGADPGKVPGPGARRSGPDPGKVLGPGAWRDEFDLTDNWDKLCVPVGSWMMEKEGYKRVEIAGVFAQSLC